MTTLLAQLEAKWRKQSEQVNAVAVNPLNSDSGIDAGLADGLQSCADDLHATVAQMTCGNCRFYVEQTHKTPFGRAKITDCAKGHLFQPTPQDFCSHYTPRPTDTETK